ncbi:hypothetical protein DSECCO2_541970 [anaerobic digester metagenome]
MEKKHCDWCGRQIGDRNEIEFEGMKFCSPKCERDYLYKSPEMSKVRTRAYGSKITAALFLILVIVFTILWLTGKVTLWEALLAYIVGGIIQWIMIRLIFKMPKDVI